MRKPLLFILLLLAPIIEAANFTNTGSGNFSAGATWAGGVAPSASGDTFFILTNTTVVYDVDNHLTTGWGASTNHGWLVMTNLPCYLLMNGNLSGNGTNLIGSASSPVPFTSSNTPMCYMQFTNTAQCAMVKPASQQWYGTPHLTNMYLSAFAELGATSITVSNVPSWLNTNDVIWIAPTNTTTGQGGEYYMVGSISGNTISFQQTLTGNTNFIPGKVMLTSIPTAHRPVGTVVAVLSCSVVDLEFAQRSISLFTATGTNSLTGIAIQNTGRGLFNSCKNLTFTSCTFNNTANGGGAYNNCLQITFTSCTFNNTSYGGGANSSCLQITFTSCTFNNTANGGGAYTSCLQITFTSCTFTNALMILCYDSDNYGFTPISDTIYSSAGTYQPLAYNNQIWISVNGLATNISGTNVFIPSVVSVPVPMCIEFGLRPRAYRNISINTAATNSVVYTATVQVGNQHTAPISMTTINSGGNGGSWTNTILSLANTNNYPETATLWLAAICPNLSSNGYATVTLGQDMAVSSF